MATKDGAAEETLRIAVFFMVSPSLTLEIWRHTRWSGRSRNRPPFVNLLAARHYVSNPFALPADRNRAGSERIDGLAGPR
jgi:hypothetical protein